MIIHQPEQKILTLSDDIQIVQPRVSAAAADWWLPSGLDPADVAGVWKPKGAASLAASYLRLAGDQGYANIDPAVVGGVAPTWAGATGWIGNGVDQYLDTGIVPPVGQDFSAFIQFSGLSGAQAYILACQDGFNIFRIRPIRNTNVSRNYRNGSDDLLPAGIVTAGNMGIAGNKAYLNGAAEAGTMTASGDPSALSLFIFAQNGEGVAAGHTDGNVISVAVYMTILTAPQSLELATNQAAH